MNEKTRNPEYAEAAETSLIATLMDSGLTGMPGIDGEDGGDVAVCTVERFSERLDLGPRAGNGLVVELEDGARLVLQITAYTTGGQS